MKYYIDTEFHEYKMTNLERLNSNNTTDYLEVDTIELISIGIVAADGREYYAVCKEFDIKAAIENDWLFKNVICKILVDWGVDVDSIDTHFIKDYFNHNGKTREQIANEIKEFVYADHFKSPIEFYAYFADYDWVVFCWLFGRMIDLPKGFPMYCRDLKQILDEKAFWLPIIDRELTDKLVTQDSTSEDRLKAIKNMDLYPKQGENEHNALSDARWNKKLHKFLLSYFKVSL